MILHFVPVRMEGALVLDRAGDMLVVNGRQIDFGALAEGESLPAAALDCPWLAADPCRRDGRIEVTLTLPHGPDAPEAVRWPLPLHLDRDGPVAVPGQG